MKAISSSGMASKHYQWQSAAAKKSMKAAKYQRGGSSAAHGAINQPSAISYQL
jgi:hypothetical protein